MDEKDPRTELGWVQKDKASQRPPTIPARSVSKARVWQDHGLGDSHQSPKKGRTREIGLGSLSGV